MQQISFRDVVFQNTKSLCDCLIKKGMNLEQAFEVICKIIKCIEEQLDLDKVKLIELGIKDKCNLKTNLLTAIINALHQADVDILLTIGGLQQTINNINTSIGLLKDEKVKTSAGDATPGYLDAKITTDQPGCVQVLPDAPGSSNFRIVLSGFVPIGAVMYVNRSRLVDFDVTGKGKINTDVYGYAIGNGSNGTVNRLDKFPRYAANPATAGNTGGANSAVLQVQNIPSMTLPVSGTIAEALTATVKMQLKYSTNLINDGNGGSTLLLRHTPNNNGPYVMNVDLPSLKHAHLFTLNAKLTNANPTAIDLVPEYILEIPIERIPV